MLYYGKDIILFRLIICKYWKGLEPLDFCLSSGSLDLRFTIVWRDSSLLYNEKDYQNGNRLEPFYIIDDIFVHSFFIVLKLLKNFSLHQIVQSNPRDTLSLSSSQVLLSLYEDVLSSNPRVLFLTSIFNYHSLPLT